MNWKNLSENLIIVIVSALVGGFIGYMASTKSNKQVILQLTPTIQQAIDKETIKNEIKNEIGIDIDKIKKSDSIQININQDPNNNMDPVNVLEGGCDDGSICIPINNLTRKQKRRLGFN